MGFGVMQLAMDQPSGLRQKCEKQSCGEKLRAAEALGCKKSRHMGEPLVLP